MKHIILIGFMGCGKTRVGRLLSQHLELPFIDMDEKIVERAGMPVTEIFAKYGEEHFRKLETETLQGLLAREERTVISSGGGVPMQSANQPFLAEGIVVYIKASVEVLMKRLAGDKSRPILKGLQGDDLRKKIIALKDERDSVYERLSNIMVETSSKSVSEVVCQIIEGLSKIS